jgi:8-oxo-dGTP pyrophosphatase MutT (NUDIX family)
MACMSFSYDDRLRDLLAQRCAAFPHLGPSELTAGLKRAAVAILLLESKDGSGEAAFLLTRRAKGLRGHSGQWALPGGRCDAGETVAQAALREIEEEVGVSLGNSALLGTLDDYPTRSGYLITPVVVWAGVNPVLRLNHEEVAFVNRVPLAEIARETAAHFTTIPESPRRLIHMDINRTTVHAPTAALLYQFRELLAGRITRVADLEQPVFAWR